MKTLAATLLALVAFVGSVSAETRRHHRHGPRHIVGTQPRHGEPGFPITAEKDSIRINAVGEVISQPVPVIQKEHNFNNRARRELANPPAAVPPQP